MNRRRFLTFCGLGIATAGGYFGWRRYHLPSIPEGMKVGTQHIEGDIFWKIPHEIVSSWNGKRSLRL